MQLLPAPALPCSYRLNCSLLQCMDSERSSGPDRGAEPQDRALGSADSWQLQRRPGRRRAGRSVRQSGFRKRLAKNLAKAFTRAAEGQGPSTIRCALPKRSRPALSTKFVCVVHLFDRRIPNPRERGPQAPFRCMYGGSSRATTPEPRQPDKRNTDQRQGPRLRNGNPIE